MTGAFVSRLAITAIKGFALEHPDEIELATHGAVGDRDLLVVDAALRLLSTSRTGAFLGLRARLDRDAGRLVLRDGDGGVWDGEVVLGGPVSIDLYGLRDVAGRLVEGPWAAVLTERAGLPVRLVLADEPGAASDVHPVSLLGDATLAHLADRSALDEVDHRRFRMLIALGGTVPYAEDGWAGRRARIGGALVEVGGPVPRCAAVTRHPVAGDRDVPLVRMIRDLRGVQESELGPGVNLGVYGRVLEPGRVRVGDAIALEDGAVVPTPPC